MAVFFYASTKTQQEWTPASFALHDAFKDFGLSRQAIQVTLATNESPELKAGNKAASCLINANIQVNGILVASDPIVLTALIFRRHPDIERSA